jgi:exonuclease VII large subunit
MSEQLETTNPLDPFDTLNTMRDASLKTWQTMRDASLETWSRMMIDLVNSEAYSRATSQWLDTYLTLSQPLQRMLDITMTQVLTRLNMPMRSDVTSLAERLTNIEMRLDDLDARLDDINRAIQALAASHDAADTSAKASVGPANDAGTFPAAKPGRTQGKAKEAH